MADYSIDIDGISYPVPRDGLWHPGPITEDGTRLALKDGGPILSVCFGIMPPAGVTPRKTWTGSIDGELVNIDRGCMYSVQIRPFKHREKGDILNWTNKIRNALKDLAPGTDVRWDKITEWNASRWNGDCPVDLGMTGSPFCKAGLMPAAAMKHVMRAEQVNDGYEHVLDAEDSAAVMLCIEEMSKVGCMFMDRLNVWHQPQAHNEFGYAGYRGKWWAPDPRVEGCGDSRTKGAGFWPIYNCSVPYGFDERDNPYAGTAESGGPVADGAHFTIDELAWIARLFNSSTVADLTMGHIRAAMSAFRKEEPQQRTYGWLGKAVGIAQITFGIHRPDYTMELVYYAQQITDKLEARNYLGGNPRGSAWLLAVPQDFCEDWSNYGSVFASWGGKKFMIGLNCMGLAILYMAMKQVDSSSDGSQWDITVKVKKQLDIVAANMVQDYCTPIAHIEDTQQLTNQGLRSCEFAAMGSPLAPYHKPATNDGMNGVEQTLTRPGLEWLLITEKYNSNYQLQIKDAIYRIDQWGGTNNGDRGYYGAPAEDFQVWINWLSVSAMADTLYSAERYFTGAFSSYSSEESAFDPKTGAPPGFEDDSAFRG